MSLPPPCPVPDPGQRTLLVPRSRLSPVSPGAPRLPGQDAVAFCFLPTVFLCYDPCLAHRVALNGPSIGALVGGLCNFSGFFSIFSILSHLSWNWSAFSDTHCLPLFFLRHHRLVRFLFAEGVPRFVWGTVHPVLVPLPLASSMMFTFVG